MLTVTDCHTPPLISREAGRAAHRSVFAPGSGADAGPATGVGTTRPWPFVEAWLALAVADRVRSAPQSATATEYPLPTEDDGDDTL
ncbi:hypothetical protein [Catenulispora subtropica]|uniref:Uncharacterized protein n=1 Tax=Catenulispora subtropica TaxID=450798 RepID=A0ABN2RDD7_9ACTN